MNRIRAFTLIELLIVVAIIAILAAIAVPNFLEAQVRSKVSRVKADLRTYATAMEAYAVDNNDYPPTVAPWLPPSGPDFPQPLEMALVRLSTPIAYMSQALVPEPFNNRKGWIMYRGWDVIDAGGPPPDAGTRQPIYLYLNLPNDEIIKIGTPLISILLTSFGVTLSDQQIVKLFEKRWVMVSPGPDTFFRFDQLKAQDPSADEVGLIFSQAMSVILPEFNVIYDPTNGTVSSGDLARTGSGTPLENK